MNIDAADKMPDLSIKPDGVHAKLEKYILRKAFDEPERPYLPDEVLFRQKEQFSDGVGYDWVDGLKEYAAQVGCRDSLVARVTLDHGRGIGARDAAANSIGHRW